MENGVDGILINKNNPNQMANSIIELVNLNNTQLSSNARKKVENFDTEIVKEKWKKILA